MVFIITLLAFHHLITSANSVPTSTWHPPHGNITASRNEIAPSWVAEPEERGTMSLLYSCTFTMFLCVYTAVHLNVPPPGEKKRYFYLRKTKWLLVALLAPEVVVYTAWSQWKEARWLQNERRPDKISLMQCFYVVMGGFVIDFSAVDDQECRAFIDSAGLGFKYTMHTDLFALLNIDHTSFQTISDKSKADNLAKGLVCFQVSSHGNITASRNEIAPSWVAEPEERGTMGLLYSCTFAMFLCVYTAVHLNVPPPGEKKRYFYLRKTKWLLVALLAPEVVVYTAWSQWKEARWLQNERRPDKISLMQCFYVVMGGFVIDFSAVDDQECRAFIDSAGLGFKYTMHTDLFALLNIDHTSFQTISDKSKADNLAKGLVCFQVSWMTIQTISRKIEGLPLTVLEIHTLVHVVCALFMYILWFKKPVDVRDPTVIKGQDAIRAWDMVKALDYPNPFTSTPFGRSAPNLDHRLASKPIQEATLLMALCAAYGGVHLATWSFEFPTSIENVVWRITCIVTMAGTAVSWYIRSLFAFYENHQGEDWGLWKMFRNSSRRQKVAMILTAIVTFFFILARAVITVMSFTSLRKVPAGVYTAVQWNNLVPHF